MESWTFHNSTYYPTFLLKVKVHAVSDLQLHIQRTELFKEKHWVVTWKQPNT